MLRTISVILIALLCAELTFGQEPADAEWFRQNVAPIFASRCLQCHNEDEAKGDFSLATVSDLTDSGVIEPGDSLASRLIEVVMVPADGKPLMPMHGPPLTEEQIQSIARWIDDGAAWPAGFTVQPASPELDFDWWSFKPVIRPPVPELADESWIATPIDSFILDRLNRQGLVPAERANRRTLIRRLYYDLIGLPPTRVQIDQFLNDRSPDAYEKLVDHLLASPRYGERWARHWLDVVKYADTCGYDKDKLRPHAWPYRDYVIKSFNEDKPYAKFVQEQIAGDVLFPQTADGILGLGFLAAGPWDFIGHVEVPESKIDGKVARNLDRDDMVSNTMNTFCSVTVQCARCHDHKFDPVTQQHYYSLQAVFAAVDRADRVYEDDPEIRRRRQRLAQRRTKLASQLETLEQEIRQLGGEKLETIETELQSATPSVKRPEFGYHSQIAAFVEVEKWVEVQLPEPVHISTIQLHPCHDDFNQIGAGFGFPVRFRVEADGQIIHDQAETDLENPGLAPVVLEVDVVASNFRVTATRLATRKNDFIFALAELQLLTAGGTNVAHGADVVALDSIEAPVRWRKSNLVDGIWYDAGEQEVKRLNEQRQQLLATIVPEKMLKQQQQWRQQLADTERQWKALPKGAMVYAATTEFPQQGQFISTGGKPREIRILARGDVTQPTDLVEPGTIPLHESDEGRFGDWEPEGLRRAALATWLTRDDHPLVWRSIVNRVWLNHFGRGLVDTPNDFGRMGAQPTHPELLDWLAVEFRDSGGSFKQLHRLIVTSSVYQQTSSPQSFERAMLLDQDNRWLWRFDRRRLSAEEIRDAMLQASGCLNLEMGGPGYYLFALEKPEHSPHYQYHKFDHSDATTYRRSIYRFVVRSQPDPYMSTLDCADSSQSTPKRAQTQTPIQSLTLFNSDFTLQMARRAATRIESQLSGLGPQVELLVGDVLGRSTGPEELELLTSFANEHGLDELARILFNTSEFLFVD